MKNILLMNKIASCGTSLFGSEYTVSDSVAEPVGMMVRSASLLETTFDPSLEAIARAGAGVNNIPVDRCAEEGIVVFNTPGANANAVKELALCALLLASRDVVGGIQWAGTLEGNELGVAKAVEKGKSAFGGCEISGKTLGIIGLGAIGRLLANAAVALGMQVVGCDPYLSDEAAKQLDPSVKRLSSFEEVYALSDYISLHVPATPQTKGMVNDTSIAQMKDGVRILNLARADLVDFVSLKSALASGKIKKYVTDFPTEETIRVPGIVAIPHLGASTEEAEDNCAVMAAKELIDFLENGKYRKQCELPLPVRSPCRRSPAVCAGRSRHRDSKGPFLRHRSEGQRFCLQKEHLHSDRYRCRAHGCRRGDPHHSRCASGSSKIKFPAPLRQFA